jgi:HlyD family secretion protein
MSVIAKFSPKDPAKDPGSSSSDGPEARQAETPLSAMDRRVRPPRLTAGRILGVIVLLFVFGVGGYGYVRYGLERTLSVASERVTIAAVEAAPFSDYAPVTGSVAPEDTVYLDAIEGGQVTAVLAEEGAAVEAGDLLARMKNTRLELEVLGREAQITEQQNNLAQARLAFEQNALRHERDVMTLEFQIDRLSDSLARRRPLQGGVASAAEIDDLETELAFNIAQKAVVERAQSADGELADRTLAELERSINRMMESLALVEISLGDLTLTAPITGQLTIFDLNVGVVVAPGQRIGQVDTVGSFKITALVDEFYLGRMAIGQRASVEIAGREYALEVSKVYPNVRDRQFQVDLAFTGPEPAGLRRGQTVRPRIELGETERSLVIANGPYYDETGGLWVLVVSSDGSTAIRRDVTLGRRNPEFVEVLAGLSEGERVITSSYQAFQDVERIDFN